MDGIITDKEREVIFRKSKEFGVPDDECEIILEGMISQQNLSNLDQKPDKVEKDKPKKSNSYKRRKVPELQLINLNNSQKLKEEQKSLKEENDSLLNENNKLNKEISDNIKLIEDNSMNYLNSLKFNDKVLDGFVVSDIIEDIDEIDLYKEEKGTVTWDLQKNTTNHIEPVLPHPFFVIYNYVETSFFKKYDINYGVDRGKYIEQGGILNTPIFSRKVNFEYNIGYQRTSIIPEKYNGANPLKIIISEKNKTKLVIYIFKDDFFVIELKYSVSFKNSDLRTWGDLGGKMIGYNSNDHGNYYWYSVTRVEHFIHTNLLKILNI
ncbi:MAG: hypothetical protein P8L72_05225 [Flavobacteriaceae bacterium]|nr:hypothetical protein [Flavobacteriaceae bacterium]MDG2314763.1 hypothetical protein [Flavobacteriaceae bacterium]